MIRARQTGKFAIRFAVLYATDPSGQLRWGSGGGRLARPGRWSRFAVIEAGNRRWQMADGRGQMISGWSSYCNGDR